MGELGDRPLRIFLLAGEPSGDQHAAEVAHELKKRVDCQCLGLAGPRMRAAGVEPIVEMEEVSVVGISEIIPRLKGIVRARHRLLRALRDPPDIVIPTDFPGFNLRFARKARDSGIPVLYYIGPQVWAWWKSRLHKMARAVDHVAVVFPFEVPIYQSFDIPVSYVGHPLAENLEVAIDRDELQRETGIKPGQPFVALLPGSRSHEVERCLPPMLEAVNRLRADRPDLAAIIAAASPELERLARRLGATDSPHIKIVTGNTRSVAAHARAALVTSGTATLETAALGTPLVIVYRLSWLSWMLARRFVHLRHVGLANIVAGEEVAPELLQENATGSEMARLLGPLIDDGAVRDAALQKLADVHKKLGTPGAASRVADLALNLIQTTAAPASGTRAAPA